ncbi:hypothetical protein [Pediococcus acidilactici]|uniref:hypothetical protein n=1 Tax=Pediococcus acidilactici TaxID=1254 RepID=UPI003CE6BE02
MSQKENIEQLIQIIHNQNAWYLGWIFGLLGVIGIFLGFYSYQQKKISDKQVNKFNEKINSLEKIIEDLKYSNESTLNYSLVAMSREAFVDTTSMEEQLKSYKASKKMYETYYSDNANLKRNLNLAARSVVVASIDYFEKILADDGVDRTYPEIKDAYKIGIDEELSWQKLLVDVDFDKLVKRGHELNDEKLQMRWFNTLGTIKTFWEEEVAE